MVLETGGSSTVKLAQLLAQGEQLVRRSPPGGCHDVITNGEPRPFTAPQTFETKGDAWGWIDRERRLIERDEWTPRTSASSESLSSGPRRRGQSVTPRTTVRSHSASA